ncbi:MAG: hypothetical protein ACSHX6_16670 [Akkermansiaceae bacterium]
MKPLFSLLLLCLSLQTVGAWIPKPISPPKLKIDQAMKIAMSHSKSNYKYEERKLNTFFVRSIGFMQADVSSLNRVKNKETKEEAPKVWGWKIEIIRLNDLSERDDLFINDKGEILHYMSWH